MYHIIPEIEQLLFRIGSLLGCHIYLLQFFYFYHEVDICHEDLVDVKKTSLAQWPKLRGVRISIALPTWLLLISSFHLSFFSKNTVANISGLPFDSSFSIQASCFSDSFNKLLIWGSFLFHYKPFPQLTSQNQNSGEQGYQLYRPFSLCVSSCSFLPSRGTLCTIRGWGGNN